MTNAAAVQPSIRGIDQCVLDQTVERLCMEFDGQLPPGWVAEVVQLCMRDLVGNPPGALPELGERLARQRLLDLVSAPTGPGVGPLT